MNEEFYSCPENNIYNENPPYKAEIYKSPGPIGKTGAEILKTSEENGFENKTKTKKPVFKKPDKDALSRLSSGTLATTGGVAATSVAIAASVAVFTGFVTPPPTLVMNEITTGADCVYYSVDGSEFDENTEYRGVITTIDGEEEYIFTMESGLNHGIVDDLKPNTEYNFSVIGNNNEEGEIKYLEKKFFTKKKEDLSALVKFDKKVFNSEEHFPHAMSYKNYENFKNGAKYTEFYGNENPSDTGGQPGNGENSPHEEEKRYFLDCEIYISDMMNQGIFYFCEVFRNNEKMDEFELIKGRNNLRRPIPVSGNIEVRVNAVIDENSDPVLIGKRDYNSDFIEPPFISLNDIKVADDAVLYSMDIYNMSLGAMDYRITLHNRASGEIVDELIANEGLNAKIIGNLQPGTPYILKVSGKYNNSDNVYFEREITTTNNGEPSAIVLFKEFDGDPPAPEPQYPGDTSQIDPHPTRRRLTAEIYVSDINDRAEGYRFFAIGYDAETMPEELHKGHNITNMNMGVYGDINVVVMARGKDLQQHEIVLVEDTYFDDSIYFPENFLAHFELGNIADAEILGIDKYFKSVKIPVIFENNDDFDFFYEIILTDVQTGEKYGGYQLYDNGFAEISIPLEVNEVTLTYRLRGCALNRDKIFEEVTLPEKVNTTLPEVTPPQVTVNQLESSDEAILYSLDLRRLSFDKMNYKIILKDSATGDIKSEEPVTSEEINQKIVSSYINSGREYVLQVVGTDFMDHIYFEKSVLTTSTNAPSALVLFKEYDGDPPPAPEPQYPGDTSQPQPLPIRRRLTAEIYLSDPMGVGENYRFKAVNFGEESKNEALVIGYNKTALNISVYGDVTLHVIADNATDMSILNIKDAVYEDSEIVMPETFDGQFEIGNVQDITAVKISEYSKDVKIPVVFQGSSDESIDFFYEIILTDVQTGEEYSSYESYDNGFVAVNIPLEVNEVTLKHRLVCRVLNREKVYKEETLPNPVDVKLTSTTPPILTPNVRELKKVNPENFYKNSGDNVENSKNNAEIITLKKVIFSQVNGNYNTRKTLNSRDI